MKILYVSAESTPFIKTGGLADVAGSLPKALNQLGVDCRVVLPKYGQIDRKYADEMKKIMEFYVDIGWKREYCGVYTLDHDGVTYYFLDNENYFNRPKVYGEFDDGERFIFFSKAATRLPKVIDFDVDIIHANDWHSGLVPVFVNDYRTGDIFYQDIRTVYSIHNLKYQGQFSEEVFYWTNLAGQYFSDFDLKFYDSINFLKGGLVHASKFNTVSPTYAQEILYPFYGEGLSNVLQAYAGKLSGILNGIDYDVWQTENNPNLFTNYSLESLDKKVENKTAIQEKYGLPIREDVPLFAIISRLTAMKGLDLVRYIIEEFLQEDVQFVVLGTGDSDYEQMFSYFSMKYPDKCSARLYYSNEESHQLYAAADFLLMPSLAEPCGLSQMIAMRFGTIPIVREVGGLRDSVQAYDPISYEGEGLTFKSINAHDLLFSMQNALDYYVNRKDHLRIMQENCIKKDLSWDKSSKKYLELYKSLF